MSMVRVADYIMETLHARGVQHIFVVTGRGALFLTDAVARLEAIECVAVHHEQAAAYAAVAYSHCTGGLGTCLVSTGCAATNTISGVLSAWQDGLPCVFISGQNTLQETSRHTGIPLRTYGQQETDVIPLVQPITKYAVMIEDPSQVVFEVEKALYMASAGRKGPVWIDVPLDVQSMRIDPDAQTHFVPEAALLPEGLDAAVDAVCEALARAQRPVVLLGSGVRSAGAEAAFSILIERTGIPVTYASSAVDTYGSEHPLSIGSVGTMGCTRAGNFAVQNADLLLVLGSRLTSMTTGTDFCKFARAAHIVVVDIDPVEHSKASVRIDQLVQADLGAFLPALLRRNLPQIPAAWQNKCQHWKQVFPRCEEHHKAAGKVDLYHLAEALSRVMAPDAVFVSDSGLVELILPTNIAFVGQQRCVHPVSQGAMGFALPAAVGACYASGGPVVTVVGDGSIMMNLQELQTIRHHQLPIKIFVINNNVYSIIRKRQVDMFRSRTIGTDPSNGVSCPNFAKVAAGFDLPYVNIADNADLDGRLSAVLQMPGPVLCEVMGLEDQIYLETSQARNAQRQFVRRPLEDQAPFLDRGVFLSEMVIEPIDQ